MADDHTDHHHARDHRHAHQLSADPRPSALLFELREHVPFSVTAVTLGLIVAGAICILGFRDEAGAVGPEHAAGDGHDHGAGLAMLFFHLFHPAHMLFSAVATSAMFFRYEHNALKAIIIGLIGAIGVCGISDIAMPQVSLLILGKHSPWHICVYEHPGLVLPFAVVGVLGGVAVAGGIAKSTLISHSLHVLASTMASIFYMVGPLGVIAWINDLGKVFVFVLLAVMVPCCLSDIVFPLLMSKPGRDRLAQDPHAHC